MPFPTNVFSYDLNSQRRDLNDVLSTIFQRKSNFASLFPISGRRAVNTLYEWNEDYISLRSVEATGVSGADLTISVDDSAALYVGTVLRVPNGSATFKVTAKAATSATLEFVASGGSAITSTAGLTAGLYHVVSVPMPEGSRDGPRRFNQTGQENNRTQIFRREVDMSRTSQGISVFGNEANMATQIERAMMELSDEVNNALIYGTRKQRTSTDNGSMGGLYDYATQPGTLEIDVAGSDPLSSILINDAFEMAWKAGANPSVILCSTKSARKISAEMKDQVALQRDDPARGTRANIVVNDFVASQMNVMPDIMIPDTDVFVIDPAGFNLVYFTNGDFTRMAEGGNTTLYDGNTEAIVGEITSEWRNTKQRIVRIKNLQA